MPNNLTIQIAVQGQAAAQRALSQISRSVRDASNEANAASKDATEGATKFGTAWQSVSKVLNELGRTASPAVDRLRELGEATGGPLASLASLTRGYGELVAVIGVAAAGLAALGESAARATIEQSNHARALGLSVESYEGLQYAAGQVGVSSERAGTLFTRFAARMGQAREEAEKLAAAQAAAQPSTEQLAEKHVQLADAVDQTRIAYNNAKLAIASTATSIAGADISVDRAKENLKQLKEQIGPALGASTDQRLKLREAQLALTRAENEAVAARQKAKDALDQQRIAADKLAEAERKRQTALREELTKQNAPAGGAAETVPTELREIAATGIPGHEQLISQLGAFADKYKSLSDEGQKAALAQKVFGRGWAEIVPLLNLGSEGIAKLAEEQAKLKITPTDEEEKFASTFYASVQKMTTVIEGLKNAIGNIIGQAFVPLFDKVSKGLSDNQANIRAFAQAFTNVLKPALDITVKAVGFVIDAFKEVFKLISDVSKAFGDDISPAAAAADTAIGLLAIAIGSKLIDALGAAIKVFGLFKTAATEVAAAEQAVAVTGILGPVGIIVALAALDAWLLYENGTLTTFIGTLKGVKDMAQAALSKVFDLNKEKAAETPVANVPTSTEQAGAAFAQTMAGFAGGGGVMGPSGTDRVPAMLTAGEHVMNLRAVSRLGHGFFDRLNAGHFSLGGAVRAIATAPIRFAEGGSVTGALAAAAAGPSMVRVDLGVGGKSFPMYAQHQVATALVQHSESERISSTGAKPSWYGGRGTV